MKQSKMSPSVAECTNPLLCTKAGQSPKYSVMYFTCFFDFILKTIKGNSLLLREL